MLTALTKLTLAARATTEENEYFILIDLSCRKRVMGKWYMQRQEAYLSAGDGVLSDGSKLKKQTERAIQAPYIHAGLLTKNRYVT